MSNEDIGKLLKHPLVIVLVVFIAALIFYNIISPYKSCLRAFEARKVTGIAATYQCGKSHSW